MFYIWKGAITPQRVQEIFREKHIVFTAAVETEPFEAVVRREVGLAAGLSRVSEVSGKFSRSLPRPLNVNVPSRFFASHSE